MGKRRKGLRCSGRSSGDLSRLPQRAVEPLRPRHQALPPRQIPPGCLAAEVREMDRPKTGPSPEANSGLNGTTTFTLVPKNVTQGPGYSPGATGDPFRQMIVEVPCGLPVGCDLPDHRSPGNILVVRIFSPSSITCSKVFPSSSLATLTSRPASSTYSASTGRSETLPTRSSSTTCPFSS